MRRTNESVPTQIILTYLLPATAPSNLDCSGMQFQGHMYAASRAMIRGRAMLRAMAR
jgi:hypothetical protein